MPSMFAVTLEHLGRVIYYNTKGREGLMDEIFDYLKKLIRISYVCRNGMLIANLLSYKI